MNVDPIDDPERGIAWARGGLIFGVVASVAGNVANACLSVSGIHVSLRIPGAIFWPLALFVGIEVMVRNRHRRGAMAMLGRALLLAAAPTTFITSFINLHAFMIKAGENEVAAVTGSLSIDGLMLGCTVMLLAATVRTALPLPAPVESLSRETVEENPPPHVLTFPPSLSEEEAESVREKFLAEVKKNPPPTILPEPPAPVVRRRVSDDSPALTAVALLAAGEKVGDIAARGDTPALSTMYRIAAGWREVQANPDADPGRQHRLSPAVVEAMREEVKKRAAQ